MASKEGWEVLGFLDGWRGPIEKEYRKLTEEDVRDIHRQGGTILGSSRTNPFKKGADKSDTVIKNLKELGIDALIVVGGDDTNTAGYNLYERGINVVGVPKTIDNDLDVTDYTFGYDTAVNIVMEALDRLHTTAYSHHRVIVVEIMGRHAGWIAMRGGIAGGADMILVPEHSVEIDEIVEVIKKREQQGKHYCLIAVSEGTKLKSVDKLKVQDGSVDEFGHVRLGGIAEFLAKEIEKKSGRETRHVVLGHLQRGGRPTAFDTELGLRLGVEAMKLVIKREFGKLVALKGLKIVPVLIKDALKQKLVDDEYWEFAKLFF